MSSTKKQVTANLTENDVENINFIQSNCYSVNQDFLRHITSNFKKTVQLYFRKVPEVSFLINNLDRDDLEYIELRSVEELLYADGELSTLVQELKMQPNNEVLNKRIINRKTYLLNNYKDIATVFFSLVNTCVIASNFQKFKLYFPIFLDSRGRLYFKSGGPGFGLQKGDFSKALIDLSGNHYYDIPIINKSNYGPNNKNYLDYVLSLTDEKAPFSTIRARLGILPTTISNDASCSGMSIISGFCGYIQGLYLTNVF
jgi:hypothetical protein